MSEPIFPPEPTPGGSRRPPAHRANDLDGATWTRYSVSVWSDLRKTPEELALKHPALFPQALAARLIECFTTAEQQVVLDPFAGVGSTLLAARALGKRGIGLELNPDFVAVARRRLASAPLGLALDGDPPGTAEIHAADARRLAEHMPSDSVDLVVTSPPYWDILNQKRTADYKAIRNYGDLPEDLGNIADYQQFLGALGELFGGVLRVLRPGGYCCVVVMDLRKRDRFYPFHSDLAARLEEIGFLYDDLIIWDRRHEYNSFRPLGYPAVFRVNKAHEFVLVMRKAG
ncbi:MAG: site-specific DNA-methyltransferase [Armatimonadetes bacterium]|nr:site-specific DNA-methyltransferase [Armatimonadota bacterium]